MERLAEGDFVGVLTLFRPPGDLAGVVFFDPCPFFRNLRMSMLCAVVGLKFDHGGDGEDAT